MSGPAPHGAQAQHQPAPRGDRAGRRGAVGTIAVLLPLVAAFAVAGPRLWHAVRSEPTPSVAVQELPKQQAPAASELPPERAPAPARGQVADLGRFAARDPFRPPIAPAPAKAKAKAAVPAPAAAEPAPASPPAAELSATAQPAPAGQAAAPAVGAASATPAATAAGPAATASAVSIAVNGVPEQVALDGLFPAASPLFRLVALGAGSVQIAVVPAAGDAGSTSGAAAATVPPQTVTLQQGSPLTLLDTASGARYELRLIGTP